MDNPTEQTSPASELIGIGEFADATGLSVSAVRFYANRGVLHPAAVDASSGYRRFAASQIADGQLIKTLRHLEMPLATISEALQMSAVQRHELVQRHIDVLTANVDRVQSIAHSMGATRTQSKDVKPMNRSSITHTSGSATLPARALGAALAQVLPVTGRDPETPHLMTVLFETKDRSLRIVGTDRHRLAVRDIVPTRIDADFAVVVAAATAAGWQLDVDGTVTIVVDDAGVSLTGSLDTTAPAVPAEYPDYQAVLDTPPGVTTVTTDAATLHDAIAKSTQPIWLTADPAGLTVDEGEPIPTMHTGPGHQVLLDPSYLRDALAATVGKEVVFDITTPLEPLVIRSADDGTFTSLIMPIAPE